MALGHAKGEVLYHLARRADWLKALESGRYAGSRDDLKDGFIHLSSPAQVRGSAAKHRSGERDVLLVAFAPQSLEANLKWEAASNGALFPHFYGTIDPAWAVRVDPLPIDAEGLHIFPNDFEAAL